MTTNRTKSPATAEHLRWEGMHLAYPALRDLVLERGHWANPRGEATVELLGVSFQIEDAVEYGVPIGCGRKVGKKMMAIDGAGNLAGTSYPDVNIALAGVLERFADVLDPDDADLTPAVIIDSGADWGGKFFQGAYGPRIGDQLEEVERQLRRDPQTRQAVVSLWREEDRNPKWLDRPCTTEFQLMLREDGLHCFTFMRANDLWTGTCYDVFQFGQVQAAMANVLGVPTGAYHHYATSLHIYERNLEQFGAVQHWHEGEMAVDNPRETWGPDWNALEPGTYRSWHHVRHRFMSMLQAVREGVPYSPENVVEEWYWDIIGGAL